MTDLKSALTGALRTAADEDDVHVERLLAGARRNGLRYRRRRQLALSGGAALSVVMAVGALVVVRPLWAGPSVTAGPSAAGPSSTAGFDAPGASPEPSSKVTIMTEMPSLPEAPAATTALAKPTEIGHDPLLVHVSLAKLPYPASVVQLISGDGQEILRVEGEASGGAQSSLQVQVSRNTGDLDPLRGTRSDGTVGGHPASVATDTLGGRTSTTVRWQPVAGLWAQVTGSMDRAAALGVAADVRFDRVYRCAVPFRLTNVPAGSEVTTCNLAFLVAAVQASVTVHIGTWYLTVGAMPGTVRDSNEVLGGRPAHVNEHAGDGGARIMEVRVDHDGQVGDFTAEGPYDAAIVRSVAAGYVPASGNPTDWPVNPLG